MNQLYQRRHAFWYERLLFSGLFQFLLGGIVVVFLPSLVRWPAELFAVNLSSVALYTTLANGSAFAIVFAIMRQLRHFPGAQAIGYILPTLAVTWLLAVAALFFFRFDYSRSVLMLSFFTVNIWAVVGFYIRKKYRIPKLAVVPVGRALSLTNITGANIAYLETPVLNGRRFDGVVADLHADDLPPEWERFLARCTLGHIPVFHYKQIEEMLTGKVRVEHLAENEFGALLPSPLYSLVKRVLDFVMAVILLPFLLPLIMVTALVIKLDSNGPVFFIQERLGFRGKSFRVFKFRSMYADIKGKGFTDGKDDPRITRVGKVIRKFRIDELPQVFNVIKGDMSFIGPRPESKHLADWYEDAVPFFAYRHVVRPGISGWAQVNQGYAAEVEGMKEKLQYDFYYIKHFSLWLDILIALKTIRTVVTGFGAR